MVTFLVLLVFSYNVAFLFVGTASLGLFLSSTFPSMLAYTEDILQYKGRCAGVQVPRCAGAQSGELPPPPNHLLPPRPISPWYPSSAAAPLLPARRASPPDWWEPVPGS